MRILVYMIVLAFGRVFDATGRLVPRTA